MVKKAKVSFELFSRVERAKSALGTIDFIGGIKTMTMGIINAVQKIK
jgi:hypothetical protein